MFNEKIKDIIMKVKSLNLRRNIFIPFYNMLTILMGLHFIYYLLA